MRVLLWGLAIAFATASACLAYRAPLFKVRHVEVTGLSKLLPEEVEQIRAAVAIVKNTSMVQIRSGKMEGILSRIPSVRSANVRRRLPDRVVVEILPRVPVAVLSSGAQRWELDSAGVAIRMARSDARLPEISYRSACLVSQGAQVSTPGVAEALAAVTFAAHGKPLGIAKIEVDQNADICLNMMDKVAIRIGQNDKLAAKFALFRRIYDERPDIGADVESIDVRCPEAPACLPRGIVAHARESKESRPLSQGTITRSTELRLDSTPGDLRTVSNDRQELTSQNERGAADDRPRSHRRSRHGRNADTSDSTAESSDPDESGRQKRGR